MTAAGRQSNRDPALAPLRGQLAALTRLLHREKILNYSGHASVRIPGRDAFLIQSLYESRAKVSPDSLITVDFDGNLIDGPNGFEPPREVRIHSEIFRARADVEAVVHTHSELAAAFTMVEGVELRLMKSHAVRWKSGIPIHPDPSHIMTPEQGRELADTLGPHQGALLRAHGGVLVAESVPALLIDAVHFDENARAQLTAAAIGRLKPLSEAELELLSSRSNRDQHVAKLWSYYLAAGRDAGIIPMDWNELL